MSEAAAEDRISNLPEDVLHRIHASLDIKDSARTSVLSKRWNHIWTTVPILYFVNWNPNTEIKPTSSETEKFMHFVDGTLDRHNTSNIDKFSLVCNHQLDENRFHSWISTLIKGKVKDLILCYDNPLFVPLSLFTCESLTSLELRLHPGFTFPKYISFPRLKCLKLHRFKFTDECWNQELFSNSPVLEELVLNYCTISMKYFSISIPTLKLLKIRTSAIEGGLRYCALKIHAPSLVKFTYKGVVAKEYILSSFPTLVEAVVCLFSKIGCADLSVLLQALAHVKSLRIYDQALQAIYSAYDLSNNLLKFHDVKMLKISNSLTTDQGLIALLKALPNLESLVFFEPMDDEIEEDIDEDDENDSDENDENDSDEDDRDNAESDQSDDNDNHDADSESNNKQGNVVKVDVADSVVSINSNECEDKQDSEDDSWALDMTNGCLFPHLKSVLFQEFAGNPREMKWVRLILREAKNLQTMTIKYCEDYYGVFANARSEKELMVVIPRFPRASQGCVIKFCS